MKKLTAVLSVFVALLMMAIPLTASAEQIDVAVLQISDPVVSLNGAPMLDMQGLTVQLAGGSTADGSLTQIFLDVFAGEESVGSGVLQMDDNGILGYVAGMQNAYGVSSESIGALTVGGLNGMSVTNLLESLENWDLPEKLGALVEETMATDFVMGDPEAIELDLAAGKTGMTYVPFTMDGTNYMLGLIELIENDALLGPMINSSLTGSGAGSLTEMFQESETTMQISGGMASTDDASSMMVEATVEVTSEGETVTEDIYMLVDGSMGDTQTIDATFTVKAPDSEDTTFVMTGTVAGEDFALEGTFTEGQEEAGTFSVAYASANGAGAGTDKFDLVINMDGESSFALSASEVAATGEDHFEIAIKDEYSDTNVFYTFTPAETLADGAIASGTVELGMNDGTTDYALTGAVNVLTATIESDDNYIDPTTAIDVITMTPEQSEAASMDAMTVMMTMLQNLEAGVPGLAGMSQGLFGNTMQ